jgi:hypothetical protein
MSGVPKFGKVVAALTVAVLGCGLLLEVTSSGTSTEESCRWVNEVCTCMHVHTYMYKMKADVTDRGPFSEMCLNLRCSKVSKIKFICK